MKEEEVVFDRAWRFDVKMSQEELNRIDTNPNRKIDFKTRFDEEATTGQECIYRMPVYADEPRRLQYKFYSW